MNEFKKDDKVIWDSGFGFNIALFKGPGPMYGSYTIELTPRRAFGHVDGQLSCVSISQVHPYSIELENQIREKYEQPIRIEPEQIVFPSLEQCRAATKKYADEKGKGEYSLVFRAHQEGINWALNFIADQQKKK